MLTLNDIPAEVEIVRRQTKLRGKDVDRADGQQAKGGIAAGQSIDHLMDGPVLRRRPQSYRTPSLTA